MKRVKISELKAHLSEYLREVGSGDTIIVCAHDRPVASLVPWQGNNDGLIVRPATRPVSDLARIKGIRPSGPVDIMALLDREDRI